MVSSNASVSSLSSQDLLDGAESALIGPVLQTKSNREWGISLLSPTYLFEFLASVTSSSMPQLLTLENLNQAKDLNLGLLHMFEQKSAIEIAFVKRSIKTTRSG